jgi:hypothetical protein
VPEAPGCAGPGLNLNPEILSGTQILAITPDKGKTKSKSKFKNELPE